MGGQGGRRDGGGGGRGGGGWGSGDERSGPLGASLRTGRNVGGRRGCVVVGPCWRARNGNALVDGEGELELVDLLLEEGAFLLDMVVVATVVVAAAFGLLELVGQLVDLGEEGEENGAEGLDVPVVL